jgi:hypothetical protein
MGGIIPAIAAANDREFFRVEGRQQRQRLDVTIGQHADAPMPLHSTL